MRTLKTLTPEQLDALGEYLDSTLNFRQTPTGPAWDCDNTLAKTTTWLSQHIGLFNMVPVVDELNDNGGYCDCEVMFNVILE